MSLNRKDINPKRKKKYEALKKFHNLAKIAQCVDLKNPDREAAKVAASRKHQKICKLLGTYDLLLIEELALANEYMNGSSVRRISKEMKLSRSRVEKGLAKADEVLEGLMNTFSDD